MLSRYATVCLLNSCTSYQKQQYYCTPDTNVNTTLGRRVHASCCAWYSMFVCMVFDTLVADAACAGSIAGFDTLDTAGAESIALKCVVS